MNWIDGVACCLQCDFHRTLKVPVWHVLKNTEDKRDWSLVCEWCHLKLSGIYGEAVLDWELAI